MREIGSGIVAFATDESHDVITFALSGRLWVVDVPAGRVETMQTAKGVVDPRPDPTGRSIAYVSNGALHIVPRDGIDSCLAADDDDDVSWGLAEFVAAEEMHRLRGYWWTPDGERLIAARVDESSVVKWHISDPANPDREPAVVRYPRAGTANAEVSLHVLDLDGRRVAVDWDATTMPYLVDVHASKAGTLVIVQSRDQRSITALTVDIESGATDVVHKETDDAWVEIVHRVPALLGDGRLVTTRDADDTRQLCVAGEPVTPTGLQVDSVDVGDDDIMLTATEDPTERHRLAW